MDTPKDMKWMHVADPMGRQRMDLLVSTEGDVVGHPADWGQVDSRLGALSSGPISVWNVVEILGGGHGVVLEIRPFTLLPDIRQPASNGASPFVCLMVGRCARPPAENRPVTEPGGSTPSNRRNRRRAFR